jgi:filamentous hemagglutinin
MSKTGQFLTTAEIKILANAANLPDRGDLTVAGRSLQKHGERADSLFPKARGNPQSVNEQACSIVDDILNNPDSTQTVRHHARFGDIKEIYAPDGQGIRYDLKDNFIGFIEKGD